jgi:predicted nucleic acid-binding protein
LVSQELSSSEWRIVFEELSLRHSAKKGFRTYDILHVAAALCLGCDTFWSFDRKSRDLARLEGLATN